MNIRPVPLTYKGVTFRSTLEADWAATFDELGIYWQYEPIALQLPSGQHYLPDFYLPNLHTWAEVKGPHWERLEKPVELAKTLAVDWPGWWSHIHVIILEAPGPGDAASWRAPDTTGWGDLWLTDCGGCHLWGWVEDSGKCWRCGHKGGGDHPLYWPATANQEQRNFGLPEYPTLKMTRAPRPEQS